MKNGEISKKDLDLWIEVTKTTDKILKNIEENTILKSTPTNKEKFSKNKFSLVEG